MIKILYCKEIFLGKLKMVSRKKPPFLRVIIDWGCIKNDHIGI